MNSDYAARTRFDYLKAPALLLMTLIFLIASLGAQASGPELAAVYDWTVDIELKKLERQFEFPGSTINSVHKATISIFEKEQSDKTKVYQYIWYKGGQPLGLERKEEFSPTRGEGLRIRVKMDSGAQSTERFKASADALERIFLDAYLHKNPVEIVELDNESFTPITNELQNRNWHLLAEATDVALSSTINLRLKSENGDRLTLYYPH